MLSSGARVNRLTLAVTCQTHNQCFNLYLLLAPVASMELGKGALGEFHMIRDLMALRAEDFGRGAHFVHPQGTTFNLHTASPYGKNLCFVHQRSIGGAPSVHKI